MPTTNDQFMQRALIAILKDTESTTAQKLEAARYLIEIRGTKPKRKARGKKAPASALAALLGTAK